MNNFDKNIPYLIFQNFFFDIYLNKKKLKNEKKLKNIQRVGMVGKYIRTNFQQDPSTTVDVFAEHTDGRTHTHTHTQSYFIYIDRYRKKIRKNQVGNIFIKVVQGLILLCERSPEHPNTLQSDSK